MALVRTWPSSMETMNGLRNRLMLIVKIGLKTVITSWVGAFVVVL